MFVKQQAL